MSLLERLKKASKNELIETINKSKVNDKDVIQTPIPALNIALGGSLDGGLGPGLTIFCGPSKNFKCVDGDTELHIYYDKHSVEPQKTTYKKLFDLCYNNATPNNIDKNENDEVVVRLVDSIYVEIPDLEHNGVTKSRINVIGTKFAKTYNIVFEDGDKIIVGDKHGFMDNNNVCVYGEQIKVGDKLKTINGYKVVKSTKIHSENQKVYDINIDYPHWYTNTKGGLIHHNTLYSLICGKSYMDKYPDAIMLFYDSEMGASQKYFESLNIDQDRVLHIPVTDVEQLKFDIMSQLNEIKRGDHVVIVVDSLGNLASKKEVEDALNEKSVADMTRAKSLKSLVRMIIPHLNIKNIPMVACNHTYINSTSFIPTNVMSGGTGLEYGADCIIMTSRSQEKKGSDVIGFNYTLNVMKGRSSREKARIPVTVTFEGGVNVWSGLIDMALASGDVVKPSNGWYQRVSEDGEIIDKKWRLAETNCHEFWDPIINRPHFREWIKKTFSISYNNLINDKPVISEKPDQQFTIEEE